MSRAKHRPPSPLVIAYTDHRRHVIDGLLFVALTLPVAAVYAAGVDVAPDARNAASAQPTAEVREPTGHGEPIGTGVPSGPLALPSPAAGLPVWTEDKGPVVVDGQPLPAPAPITTAPVETETAPEPETVPPATDEPAPTVTEPTPEPTDDPVVVPPDEPEVTDPEVTDPEVTDPPAEPTTPVVEVP